MNPRRPRPTNPRDPGPRPLSARQKAQQEGDAARRRSEEVINRIVPPRTRAAAPSPGAVRKKSRDADTTHRTVRVSRTLQNRRRINYPRLFLRSSLAVLGVECVAALLFSPRFWIQTVQIDGNTTVTEKRILERLAIRPHDNLFRLPVRKLRSSVLTEPAVESAAIERTFPPTVHVVVTERTPWASVKTPDGIFYTIDTNLIPFRKARVPEENLPLLTLAKPSGSAKTALGKPLFSPGLSEVSTCLAWATREQFPLETVAIDADGKLCLNRVGGMQILLGSGMDLDKKLDALSRLLVQKPTLRIANDIAYINVYAYDAPAILPRVASRDKGDSDLTGPLSLPLTDSAPLLESAPDREQPPL